MANAREQKAVVPSKKHIARLERERRQTRYILGGFSAILVIVVGLLSYGILDMTYLQPRRPIAEVDGAAIPVKDWQARVRMERSRLISEVQLYEQYQQFLGVDLSAQKQQLISQLDSPVSIGQTVLDRMIEEELVRKEAAARGLAASASEVEQAIEASFQYYPLGTPTPSATPTPVLPPTLSPESLALVTITPTPTAFPTATSQPTSTPGALGSPTMIVSVSPTPTVEPSPTSLPTATPMTLQGYEDAYRNSVNALGEQGLTEEQLRQLYEVDLLRNQLLTDIARDVPHTQEQVWARHILVPDEALAEVVRRRLEQGEDFAKIAAETSTDSSNKDRGGDLGWFGRGAMVPEFENAAFSQKVGELGAPVKTQFGYHIIQVLARGDVTLDAAAYQRARQAAFDAWLADARVKYGVVIQDNWQSIVPTEPALNSTPQ